ncbi:MAG TPA: hypothetical protein VFW08_11480 [bacterium]|nr:hypothetical protein [bacterium]
MTQRAVALTLIAAVLTVQTPAATAAARGDRAAQQVQAAYAALEAAIQETSVEAPDVRALAARLGRDPQRIFTWVRDETRWVPYRGALRDHAGVLLDRLGNSLDRALLLYALLREAGSDVRLAQAVLSPDQARDLLRRVRPAADAPVRGGRRPSTEEAERFARRHNLDGRAMRSALQEQTQAAERIGRDAAQRIRDQAAFLARKVPEAVRPQRGRDPSPALEALRDHWWVQVRMGSEWVDYDALLPDARPGQGLAQPARTLRPERLDDLDAGLLHTIRIRVIVEVAGPSGREEVEVLSHLLRPAGVLGETLVLRHSAPRWPKAIDLTGGLTGRGRVRDAVLAQHEWIPILSIGEQHVFHSSFTDTGLVRPTSRSAMAQGAERLGQRIEDILGGSGRDPGGSGGTGPAAPDRLLAEWIEFEIRTPGAPTRTVRRQIFDLLGPAARSSRSGAAFRPDDEARLARGMALLGETVITVWPAQPSPAFVTLIGAQRWLATRPLVMEFLRSGGRAAGAPLLEQVRRADGTHGALYDLALGRALFSPVAGQVYLQAASILLLHRAPAFEGDRELVMRESFDIVANDVEVRPGAKGEPGSVRLQQGVADTVLESVLPLGGRRLPSASDLLASHGRDRDWIVIRSTADRAWRSVRLPEDIKARIAALVESGMIAVVPREALNVGRDQVLAWWTVDPRTGQTLGYGSAGWGQAGTEYTLTKEEAVAYVVTIGGFLDWMICAFKHEGLPEGTKAAGKCFFAGFCLMLGGALVLGTTAFTGGLGFPIASAAVTYLCNAVRIHS